MLFLIFLFLMVNGSRGNGSGAVATNKYFNQSGNILCNSCTKKWNENANKTCEVSYNTCAEESYEDFQNDFFIKNKSSQNNENLKNLTIISNNQIIFLPNYFDRKLQYNKYVYIVLSNYMLHIIYIYNELNYHI